MEDNSYYIKYYIAPDGSEFAYLDHCLEVFDDGWSEDFFYTIDENGIEFEDIDTPFNYFDPDDNSVETKITEYVFLEMVRRIKDIRSKIENLVKKQENPLDRDITIGDYLYFLSKENINYKNRNIAMIHVTGITGNGVKGSLININKYETYYYLDYNEDEYKDLGEPMIIPKEVFEEVKNIIKTTSTILLAEMKKKVTRIEKL